MKSIINSNMKSNKIKLKIEHKNKHNKKTSSFDELDLGPKGAYGVPAQYERSFRWKLNQFRYLCQSNGLPSHIKLTGEYFKSQISLMENCMCPMVKF